MIIKKIFFSNYISSLLFIIIAISMGIATFIEHKYSTDIAKIFIYESSWFEIIILWFSINMIKNICEYKLWRINKLPIFIFHISFLLIIIGGLCTRYVNSEGTLSLRQEEGKKNQIVSQRKYIKVIINNRKYNNLYTDPYILSKGHNNYKRKFFFNNVPFKVKILKYIPCAKPFFKRNINGKKTFRIVTSNNGNRMDSFLQEKEKSEINNINFSLNKYFENCINFFEKGNKMYMISPFKGRCINMINGKFKKINENEINVLKIKHLYEIELQNNKKIYWVIPNNIEYGYIKYISSCEEEENQDDASSYIEAEVDSQGEKRYISFIGGRNILNMSPKININNYRISIGYGSKIWNLPFYVYLKKFELVNYPGSDVPSSFKSYVTILDNNYKKDYLIYMNNVLHYKGFRFFQSGYDPDNNGTHLSVDDDYIGTYLSYTGYLLMGIGMLLTLFWKGTRFMYLKKQLKNITKQVTYVLLIFFSFFLLNNHVVHAKNKLYKKSNYSNYNIVFIPKDHASKFGKLLVQDKKGRIKPINTVAIDLLRKIYKNDKIMDLDANQWFISIHQNNMFWIKMPFIKIEKKGGKKILDKINQNSKKYYVSIMDLYKVDPQKFKLVYLLENDYYRALSKHPIYRNEYDKAVIKISERVGIIHAILQGEYTKIFPIPNDNTKTWSSWITKNGEINKLGFFMFYNYLKSIESSNYKNDWKIADKIVYEISNFQKKYAKSYIPSKYKIDAEIVYNKLNIFHNLSFYYFILGFIFITNSFFIIISNKNSLIVISKIFTYITAILFTYHTFGLLLRWYISGHAPWTNGFESAIFISWWILFVGFIFYNSKFVIGITSLISSILLMIAHGSAMDPEITNLVPVLKSSWLIIHVAVITSSYGFFFTSALLGFLVLSLFILKYFFNKKNIYFTINKLTIINEMCLIIGLFLLTIGTCLGAVWANNSWGRYWSWDPKETWALISIMVYAFVIHIKMIPNIGKNILLFNFISTLSISSILMTYFGVNYYLSGLHSYAKGDATKFPNWIYYILIILFFITLLAFFLDKKQAQKKI